MIYLYYFKRVDFKGIKIQNISKFEIERVNITFLAIGLGVIVMIGIEIEIVTATETKMIAIGIAIIVCREGIVLEVDQPMKVSISSCFPM